MIPDYRHVPSSPGMWEEPDAGADGLVSSFVVLRCPTPQQQPVMSARSATRPGPKISWTTFKWVNYLKRTWFIILGHSQVWSSCQISESQVPLMWLSTNLKSIQQPFCPGLTETSPHSILTCSTFFFNLMEQLISLLCVSLSCLPLMALL